MRVVVVGAGIGGLALAQALRTRGVAVSVHDVDRDLAATGGYRLHLDRDACAALRRRLPGALYQALLASSAGAQAFRRFSFADHRMRVLAEEPRDREDEALLIGRVPLRRLLAHGLGDALRLGSEFVRHEVRADGTVAAHFADGRVEHADLLVGADGVGSRVATALAGGPTARPTGLGGIAGRARLTPALRALLPPVLRAGPALAFDATGVSLFAHVHDPDAGTVVDPAACVTVPADLEPADFVWGVNADLRRFPPDVRALAGPDLQRAAADLLDGWLPAVRALVAAPVHTVGTFGYSAADPDADLTPWPSGPVTALGDAVHAMPPTGGQAAATAIRDADLLAGELDAVLAGTATVPLAVHAYERAMPAHAVPAIRESLAPLAWQRRLAGPVARRVARVALPGLAAAHRLRHPQRTAVATSA
jgi:2-polyprenyl-6-methoxyphenol hydroxylase-like FAD-dependent oxidoreductase